MEANIPFNRVKKKDEEYLVVREKDVKTFWGQAGVVIHDGKDEIAITIYHKDLVCNIVSEDGK